ncbi:MAG TPA: DUF1501 domain-containing protein [Cytophagaceae bacterium]|jgi:uncharacterized protein (DUF1501 family)
MKRRDFIRTIPAFAAPLMLNGIPLSLMGQGSMLSKLAATSTNDRVLVLIQLHGGNDGLNAVIPANQYSQYYNLRPNIAIPDSGSRKFITLDGTLPSANQVGLHPDMIDVKSLYDQGKMAVVQGVAYENFNQSHFRSRDIWFMGGDYDDYLGSGWAGRYLSNRFPGYPETFPNETMPDPLAIELGTGVSLAFHKGSGIPMSISINNPNQFYDLINSVGGAAPPEPLAGTPYASELKYIMGMEDKSNDYAQRLKDVFAKGSNSTVTYPTKYPFYAPLKYQNNGLSSQLRLIARLLDGGCQTKVFLARMTGFDTHANQVQPGTEGDRSMGSHAALLYHMSSAMKAFQDDLEKLGMADKVMAVTFSEFGRRAASNASYGTDHGTSAPMFVFGKCVKPGVVGATPNLSDLDGGNIKMQFDYRQVFTTLLQDWMGASDSALDAAMFTDFRSKRLDLVSCSAALGTNDSFTSDRFKLNTCAPNPVKTTTTFSYYINAASHVSFKIFDTSGRLIKELVNENQEVGVHEVTEDLSSLEAGAYIYKIEAGSFKAAKAFVKL